MQCKKLEMAWVFFFTCTKGDGLYNLFDIIPRLVNVTYFRCYLARVLQFSEYRFQSQRSSQSRYKGKRSLICWGEEVDYFSEQFHW